PNPPVGHIGKTVEHMTGKGDEQENVQKKKTRLQAHILLLFRKHDKHASHSSSGESRNSPLDHVFPDEAAKIFLIVNPVVQKRNRSEEHTSELQSRFDLVCR